jgi:hypothetical protein
MRLPRLAAVVLLVLAVALPASARGPGDPPAPRQSNVRAGVGIADATWHVGAGSGQYADKNPNAGGVVTDDEVDPHGHGTTQQRSYGVHSRLTYRALVVEGNNGQRVALVKSDSYLAQDLLVRRVGQILANGGSGITRDDILLMATHNHSSPYYTTPAWGVMLFQDAYDARAFEYHARQMAAAIEEGAANLRPARMGGTVVEHRIYKGNIAGATVADDGTPAGYPDDHADFGLTVLRFDDVSAPGKPKPIGVFVNHGQHPESLDGYDLITADYLAPLERYIERDLGAPLIFSQGDVGSAEGPYLRDNFQVLPDGVIRAWAHVGHAQTERGARYLADSIIQAWEAIGRGDAVVPFTTDFPVAVASRWIPGPLSHPYPSVSNCRTETTAEGAPGSPILGLPDCERGGRKADPGSMIWENLKVHGLPLPEHYDAPGFTSVEENARLHLQAFRLGEVLLASCACEAQMDLILNLESRLNDVEGDLYDGYDWTDRCTVAANGSATCTVGSRTLEVSPERWARMQAQIHNDAKGWDAPQNAVAANAEPPDPAKIWGNFTKEELPTSLGYALPIGVGHATDYNGYTVSYREYVNRDHYRKALTSYGPHTADYMNTRLVRMAGELKGGLAYEGEPHDTALAADEARQEALAVAAGHASSAAFDSYFGNLPNDAGRAEALVQPADITRFAAATFTWRGGSNAVDNPVVRVERQLGNSGKWVPFADQSGEVQTMVDFPEGGADVARTHAGAQEWRWTANFEAFSAFPARLGQTPAGTYRFVVEGQLRQGGKTVDYALTSEPFAVAPWDGINVSDARAEDDGSVSFVVDAITYPRTYESPFRFVADDGRTTICKTCSFRPWASTAEVASATVTVTRADGTVEQVAATLVDSRWVAATALRPGNRAVIERGGVVDTNGEINGAAVPVP